MIVTRCHCGFKVSTETAQEGIAIARQHYKDKHPAKKKSWIKKTFEYLKENRFLI